MVRTSKLIILEFPIFPPFRPILLSISKYAFSSKSHERIAKTFQRQKELTSENTTTKFTGVVSIIDRAHSREEEEEKFYSLITKDSNERVNNAQADRQRERERGEGHVNIDWTVGGLCDVRRDAPRRAIQQSFFASFNRSRTLTHTPRIDIISHTARHCSCLHQDFDKF